jgi:hypothetical protein
MQETIWSTKIWRAKKKYSCPVLTMKAYRGSRGIAPWLDGGDWGTQCPQLPYLQESTPVPTEEEAGWTPELVWIFWRGEKSLATARIRTLDHLPHSLATIPITLSWLHDMLGRAILK